MHVTSAVARPCRPRRLVPVVVVLALALNVLAGCGLLAPSRTNLYEGQRGRVFLETVASRGSTATFRPSAGLDASQPVIIEPSALTALLRGLHIAPQAAPTTSLRDGAPTPIFSEDEAAFLAPLLSTALTKATASQFVGFELEQAPTEARGPRPNSAGSSGSPAVWPPTEKTSGALYVAGHAFHLALTTYRYLPERLQAVDRADPRMADGTGLSGYAVSFTPASALRSDRAISQAFPVAHKTASFVVDYQALQATLAHPNAAAPPVAPVPSPGSGIATDPTAVRQETIPPAVRPPDRTNEVQDLKDLVIQKDLELERLRKELHQLKQAPAP